MKNDLSGRGPRQLLAMLFLGMTGCLLHGGDTILPGVRYAGRFDAGPVHLPRKYRQKSPELRGVWVATIHNLDFPLCETQAIFQQRVQALMRSLAAAHFNAVFFQVRPSCDAFYPSRLNPWSRYLTGREGRPPGNDFDPLRFLIDEAHRNKLEFHAWLNPYRVTGATELSKKAALAALAPGNFARKHPELVMETMAGSMRKLTLNPGEPAVRDFITATVLELLNNYALDGIHFDDYFYPDGMPEWADRSTYLRRNPKKLPLDDWRRGNVDLLIRSLHEKIAAFNRASGRKIRFGVSPAGVWRNRKSDPAGSPTAAHESYALQYADTRRWVKSGWLDYIAPQLYWHFNHDSAAYGALCDWWCDTVRGTRTDLYIGHALYRLGEKEWGRDELYHQLLYNHKHSEIKGSILFSWRSFAEPANPVMRAGGAEMLRNLWSNPVPAR